MGCAAAARVSGFGFCPFTRVYDRERPKTATDFALGSRNNQPLPHVRCETHSLAERRIAARTRWVDPERSGTARRTTVRAKGRPYARRRGSRIRNLRSGGSGPQRADSRLINSPEMLASLAFELRNRPRPLRIGSQQQTEDSFLCPLLVISGHPANHPAWEGLSFPCHAPGSSSCAGALFDWDSVKLSAKMRSALPFTCQHTLKECCRNV
jgi:hypothetical protein